MRETPINNADHLSALRTAFVAALPPAPASSVDPYTPVPFSAGCARMGFARSTGYAMLKAQAAAEEQNHAVQPLSVPKPHKRHGRNFFFEYEVAQYNRAFAAANNKLTRPHDEETSHVD